VFKRNYRYETFFFDNSRIINMIQKAYEMKSSLSLGRFGIGEISYLSWPTNTLLLEDFKRYQSYAGINGSPDIIKSELLTALKTVDIAGFIMPWRLEYWAQATDRVLENLKFFPKTICCAWLMHDMVHRGTLWTLLNNKKVILIGRRSQEAAPIFLEKGVTITGVFNLNGFEDLETVFHSIVNETDWEIALISAGIPATILSPRIAKYSGKIAIDFGHALDIILDGDSFNHSKLVEEWNSNRNKMDEDS
jgi:hypothetical protein